MALGALHEAPAPEPAGAQCDLRLQDMVAAVEWIALGVEEGENAGLLIVVQHVPGHRHRGGGQYQHGGEHPIAHAGTKEDRAAGRQQHAGGAQVRLLQHQPGWHQHQDQGDDEARRAAQGIGGQAVEVAGQGQHQGDLHDLRGLQLEDLEVDPALRTHAAAAGHLHRRQQS